MCGYSFDGPPCTHKGAHYCKPRADRVVAFFTELLVHTKGQWARQRFDLASWQEHEIVRPLFGEVIWSQEWSCYIRRYRIAWIELARKNGKSELAAGICLYLTVGDDEEGAEVYGAAKDTKQARKVWEPAERMRTLSAPLAKRLGVNKNEKRIYDIKTASYYEVITSDAAGELGHNPHGFVIDEVLAQPNGDLWTAMRTAMGTRRQPLMLALTTATDDPSSFCAVQHSEMVRIAEDPARAPHVFVYCRNTPRDADPWDEANWAYANPALGSFLAASSLRDEALEARNDPSKENSFRQFRLNQHVQQVTRWMPLHLWDASAGMVVPEDLAGRSCFGGLDLASTTDLAAWVLLFPDDAGGIDVLWRFWSPEAQLPHLDRHTGGQASVWARQGLLSLTEGDWISYDDIHAQIRRDKDAFRIVRVGYDPHEATATSQYMQGLGLDVAPVPQGFALSEPLKELMRLVKASRFRHGGNPVARWHADSVEVKRSDEDHIKIVKPDRASSGKRIDGLAAAATALKVYIDWVEEERSVYETRGMASL
ncbi:MAG: terminase large subunit [Actinobacteria bacterium]|nr:terminase large subunit [Actinomycetota bacterium]